MKRNRILLCLLWILSLVGISFYGGPITYGFFIMVTMVPLLSFAYLIAVRLRFSIYQQLIGKTFVAGRAIPYYFTLQNEDWFAFASVKVFFYSDFSTVLDLKDGEECELLPGTGIKKDTTLICKYRGTYQVGIRTVEITDFLRLFRMHYKNPEPLDVTINPRTVSVSELKSIRLPRILNREQPAGRDVLTQLTREYVPGDDPRRIHWKATARTGQLMTRQEIGEEQQNVSILLSACRYADSPSDYLPTENRMLEIALALSRFFLLQGIPVRAFHRAAEPASVSVTDNASFENYYRLLCGLFFHETQPDDLLFSELPVKETVMKSRAVFLILSRYGASSDAFVRLLNECGIAVIVYLVAPADAVCPDLSSLPRTELVRITPDEKLEEVL